MIQRSGHLSPSLNRSIFDSRIQVKRMERYMGMFCGLGSGVLLKELDHVQLSFENAVEWAMEHLLKDDRII